MRLAGVAAVDVEVAVARNRPEAGNGRRQRGILLAPDLHNNRRVVADLLVLLPAQLPALRLEVAGPGAELSGPVDGSGPAISAGLYLALGCVRLEDGDF